MTEQTRLQKLAELRTELADMAFALERQGRLDAADLATSVSQRLGELCDEPLERATAAYFVSGGGGSSA
jgi:hypothetical protein